MSLNTGFLVKPHGILKLLELVLGIICVSLAGEYYNYNIVLSFLKVNIFFLTISVTLFVITSLMVISSVISEVSHNRLRQTLFDPVYHFVGFILLFSASVAVLAENDKLIHAEFIKALLAAGSLGLINSILYALSAYDSYQAYINA